MKKVSCLMRAHYYWKAFTQKSIISFLSQDYSNKELIIVDGSGEGKQVLISMGLYDHPEIIYYYLPVEKSAKKFIEYKNNIALARKQCEKLATGYYLLSWDDDDINFPDRITESVKSVQGFDAAMINDLFIFYENKYYLYPMNKGTYRPEFTAIYKKEKLPEMHKEGGYWNMQRSLRRLHVGTIMKNDIFIMRIHHGNNGTTKKDVFKTINQLKPIKFTR